MPLAVLPVTPLDLAYPSAVQDVFAAGFTDPPNLALPLLHPGQDIFSPGFRKLRDEHATVYSASSDSRWQYSTKCIDTDPTVPTIQEVVDEKASFNGVTNGNVNETMAVDRRAAALATAPSAPGGGAVVGMATWEVYHRSRTPEEWMPPNGVTWLPEGSEERRQAEAFFVALWKKRAEIWEGRKYVYLQFLSVHPAHRRRGIASRIMQWGIDIADQLHLPIYLEATLMGVPLYEKLGFQLLKENFFVRNVGFLRERGFLELGSDDLKIPIMVKMPSAAKGMTFEEWKEKGFPDFP